jgi:hypothetical protein
MRLSSLYGDFGVAVSKVTSGLIRRGRPTGAMIAGKAMEKYRISGILSCIDRCDLDWGRYAL